MKVKRYQPDKSSLLLSKAPPQKDLLGRVMSEREFEDRIQEFGKNIFREIGKTQPSAFNTSFWTGKIMEWSMQFKTFKTDMFRLVDVLPSLQSSRSIAVHVSEYLSESAKEISGLASWGVNVPPKSIRAKATSFAVKQGVSQMAKQFIAGETPKGALKELKRLRKAGLSFTVDLLGEYCVSEKEAEDYLGRYQEAIRNMQTIVDRSREVNVSWIENALSL